jgi:aryl-alcohol dehydrogenase-like predicted oxidoreductase
MKCRPLADLDIDVSVNSLSTWQFGGDFTWGEQDDSVSINTVHTALDEGINLIDTAEMYGNGKSEQVIGKALKGKRDKAVIATKVLPENLAYEDVIAACERSLDALDTDYIDLYQIHWPNDEIPMEETIRAFEDLKAQGKIRAIGVSNYGPVDLGKFLELRKPVTNQLPYSLLWRAIKFEIQEICQENQIGILCYSPLAQGILTGKFESPEDVPKNRARTRSYSEDRAHTRHQGSGHAELMFQTIDRIREIAMSHDMDMGVLSLAWLIKHAVFPSVIVGARNPQQIQQNASAGSLDPGDQMMEELDHATRELNNSLGPNIDMYQTNSRIN